MKRRLRLSPAVLILSISGMVSLVIFGILYGMILFLGGKQDTQTVAERWSKSEENKAAQVSVF